MVVEDLHAGLAQARKHSSSPAASSGTPEDTARRGAHGLGVPGAHGSRQADDAGRAEGLGGTQNCAEVAGVLQAGKHNDQRRSSLRAPSNAPRSNPAAQPARQWAAELQWSARSRAVLWVAAEFRFPAAVQRVQQLFSALRHKDAVTRKPARRASSSRFGPSIPAKPLARPGGPAPAAAPSGGHSAYSVQCEQASVTNLGLL